MVQMQNPFLFGQIPTDISLIMPQGQPSAPAPAPQAPQPAPQAPAQPKAAQPDADFENRRQRWKTFLNDPRVKAGMMQFGMALMAGSGLGGAVNQGIGAAGRYQTMERERQVAQAEQQRQRQLEEREFGLDQRRVSAYERSVELQGLGSVKPGDVTERERFDTQQEQQFEKMVRDRAQDEYVRALETYQQQQLFNPDDPTAWGQEPDFNEFYYKVATEEVLRSRGQLPVLNQLSPEQRRKIYQIAQQRGVETAIAVIDKLSSARTPAQPQAPATVQTGG